MGGGATLAAATVTTPWLDAVRHGVELKIGSQVKTLTTSFSAILCSSPSSFHYKKNQKKKPSTKSPQALTAASQQSVFVSLSQIFLGLSRARPPASSQN